MLTSSFRGVLFGWLLVVTCQPAFAGSAGDYEELCRLFKNGTRIRKPGTCDHYIQCVDGEGTLLSCPSGESFDPNEDKCVTTLANSHQYCGNRCEGLDGQWVSDPTECHKYFYCMNGVPLAGMCPVGQHFEESSQSCLHGVDSQCVDVNNICELVAKDTKFRAEDDCSSYYKCDSKGNHEVSSCTSKAVKYFDVESGNCVEPKLVECTAHPKAGICSSSQVVVFKSDGASCRGYFMCKALHPVADLDPQWMQCPEGYFFDEELQVCGRATSVICTHNRCDGRGTMLVTSSSNNCHNFIRCENNKEVEEETCHFDHFFDERIEACSSTIIYDKCCDDRD
ncbi:peritrophin-44 [Drosophila rhopaloa]|uniref:Chitin-binding type-2 domain-containing protein n=1 Tax=Drosophila rhopaloa TaxID=1041015 RepID=A0ABM5H6Y2_DRORH|nr:peritrophin-44 [Drosophila rhopaloa]